METFLLASLLIMKVSTQLYDRASSTRPFAVECKRGQTSSTQNKRTRLPSAVLRRPPALPLEGPILSSFLFCLSTKLFFCIGNTLLQKLVANPFSSPCAEGKRCHLLKPSRSRSR
eukprot:scaffold582_cov385-Prasinococcus_capsulatus_cf.AAC.44